MSPETVGAEIPHAFWSRTPCSRTHHSSTCQMPQHTVSWADMRGFSLALQTVYLHLALAIHLCWGFASQHLSPCLLQLQKTAPPAYPYLPSEIVAYTYQVAAGESSVKYSMHDNVWGCFWSAHFAATEEHKSVLLLHVVIKHPLSIAHYIISDGFYDVPPNQQTYTAT